MKKLLSTGSSEDQFGFRAMVDGIAPHMTTGNGMALVLFVMSLHLLYSAYTDPQAAVEEVAEEGVAAVATTFVPQLPSIREFIDALFRAALPAYLDETSGLGLEEGADSSGISATSEPSTGEIRPSEEGVSTSVPQQTVSIKGQFTKALSMGDSYTINALLEEGLDPNAFIEGDETYFSRAISELAKLDEADAQYSVGIVRMMSAYGGDCSKAKASLVGTPYESLLAPPKVFKIPLDKTQEQVEKEFDEFIAGLGKYETGVVSDTHHRGRHSQFVHHLMRARGTDFRVTAFSEAADFQVQILEHEGKRYEHYPIINGIIGVDSEIMKSVVFCGMTWDYSLLRAEARGYDLGTLPGHFKFPMAKVFSFRDPRITKVLLDHFDVFTGENKEMAESIIKGLVQATLNDDGRLFMEKFNELFVQLANVDGAFAAQFEEWMRAVSKGLIGVYREGDLSFIADRMEAFVDRRPDSISPMECVKSKNDPTMRQTIIHDRSRLMVRNAAKVEIKDGPSRVIFVGVDHEPLVVSLLSGGGDFEKS